MSDPRQVEYLRQVQDHFAQRDASRRVSPLHERTEAHSRRMIHEEQPQHQAPRGRSEPPYRRIPNNQTDRGAFDYEEERDLTDLNADRTGHRVIPDMRVAFNGETVGVAVRIYNDEAHEARRYIQRPADVRAPVVQNHAAAGAHTPARSPATPVPTPISPRSQIMQQPPNRLNQFVPRGHQGPQTRQTFFPSNDNQRRSASAHRLAPNMPNRRPLENRPVFNWPTTGPRQQQLRNSNINGPASAAQSRNVAPHRPMAPPRPMVASNTVAPQRNMAPLNTVPPHRNIAPSNTVATQRNMAPQGNTALSNTVAPQRNMAQSSGVAPQRNTAQSNTVAPQRNMAQSNGVARPRDPSATSMARESNQRREITARNEFVPDRNFGARRMEREPNFDGFPAHRPRQFNQVTPPYSRSQSTARVHEAPPADQSSFFSDPANEPEVPRRPDDLLLNVNEPILASSVNPSDAIVGLSRPTTPRAFHSPTINQQQVRGEAELPPIMFPEFLQFNQQPVAPVAQYRQQSEYHRQQPSQFQHEVRAPDRQQSSQRPLSHHLAPTRANPQSRSASRNSLSRYSTRQPTQDTHRDNFDISPRSPRITSNQPNSPRVPYTEPQRNYNPPSRPQSSAALRQPTPHFWGSSPTPEPRNTSNPESDGRSQNQRNPATNQPAPEILRAIENLPDVGLQGMTDLWGLQNDTTAALDAQPLQQWQPQSILIRRPNDIPVEQLARNEQEPLPYIDLSALTSQSLDGMDTEELQNVLNALYGGTPREKYKETYPYIAEGVVQKDSQCNNMLKVFSSRVGKVHIPDNAARGNKDYVYFIVAKEGDYRGFLWDFHPVSLVSSKFPSDHKICIKGYAILGHAGKAANRAEGRWICWNDSMGMMNIVSGAARTSLKKQPVWDKQLDIVSITSSFENNRFIVTTLVALTNLEEKKRQFPEEVFLVPDMIFRTTINDDLIFYSPSLDISVSMKNTLVDEFDGDVKRQYEVVVVPTFPRSTTLEFRGILLITNSVMFWSKEKEWVREKLMKRTEAYRAEAINMQSPTTQPSGSSGPSTSTSNPRTSRSNFPPRSK